MKWNSLKKKNFLALSVVALVSVADVYAQNNESDIALKSSNINQNSSENTSDSSDITLNLSDSYDFKTINGVAGRLQAHDNDLMGDLIDKKTGSMTLEHIDISLSGNSGLEVALRRKFNQGSNSLYQQAFGNWVLDLPKAYESFGVSDRTVLPEFNGGCEQKSVQHRGDTVIEGAYFAINDHSSGTVLHIPGKGVSEGQTGLSDPKTDWIRGAQELDYAGRCAAVSIAPDGTKYKFGRQVFRYAPPMSLPYRFSYSSGGVAGGSGWHWASMEKKYSVLLVTEVVDVHGNWVRYEYTDDSLRPELRKIYSNDGREIALQYSNDPVIGARNSRAVTHITANNRTWNYEYSSSTNAVLSKVTLPDGRYWDLKIGEQGMKALSLEPYLHWNCVPSDYSFSIKHPDGAVGTFTLRETRHLKSARSRLTVDGTDLTPMNIGEPTVTDFNICISGYQTNAQEPREGMPFYRLMSLVEKKISGPNIQDAIWKFEYRGYADGGENDDWNNIDQTWSKVTEPDGTSRTYTYQAIGLDHGLLKSTDVVAPDGATETFTYDYDLSQKAVICNNGGFEEEISGICLLYTKRPTIKTTHIRNGVAYTTEQEFLKANDGTFFDYGRPNKITKYSTLQSEQRITDVEYWHNPAANIIGLPKRALKNGKEFVYYEYNDKGQPEYVNKFGKLWNSYTYHDDGADGKDNGNLHTVTDPLLHSATLTDYYRGQPRHITRRDGTTLERTVDDNGWVTSETNARGFTTTYGYTPAGWMNRITPPSPWEATNITYHNLGTENFYRSIRSGTKEIVEWYDSMLRLTREGQQALSGGGLSTYTTTGYDAMGRQTFVSLPSYSLNPTEGTTTTYDGLGRVTGTSQNFGKMAKTFIEYLPSNKVLSRDPLNNETITERSGYGSPDDGQAIFIDQPEDVNTAMSYDIYGNILTARQFGNSSAINADSTQTWKYNDRLQPCIQHVPETGYKVFKYDAADQVKQYAEGLTTINMNECPDFDTQAVPSSGRITMAYDELGRTKSVDYPDATPDVYIDYDANGNVTRNLRGTTVWNYVYDNLDHLMQETLSVDTRTYALGYQYNTMGNLQRRTLPSGRVIDFNYNGLGQMTQVASNNKIYASDFTYHVNGLIANMRYGNGHAFAQTLNANQQPKHLTSQFGLVKALDLDYDYDVRGQVTSIIDGTFINGSRNRSMTYDDLGRLKTANGAWGTGSFTYDSLGNLHTKRLGSRLVTVNYDTTSNRATQSTDTAGTLRTIDYDTRGNVTQLGALNFVYDKANQPTTVTGSSGGTYTYDGNFKRVKVNVDGKVIYNVFDAAGSLVHVDEVVGGTADVQVCFTDCAKVAVLGPQTTDYINAGNVSVRLENNQPTYMHNDLLGSPVAATDAFGMVIWQEHYTPYGEKWQRAAANDDQGSFTGHIADSATGLTYMQARYYDPVIGRFLSNDPVGFAPSRPEYFNRYAYVGNDPVNYVDPAGTNRMRPPLPGEIRRDNKFAEIVGEKIAKALPDGATKDFVQRGVDGLKAINKTADRAAAQTNSLKISDQKQNAHVAGTKENARRNESGTPTSTFDDRKTADRLTTDTVATGTATTDANGTTTYRKDYGERVGTGPNGGDQTQVKVHQDSKGVCHGHPCGPES